MKVQSKVMCPRCGKPTDGKLCQVGSTRLCRSCGTSGVITGLCTRLGWKLRRVR
jgi:hypothetical protein